MDCDGVPAGLITSSPLISCKSFPSESSSCHGSKFPRSPLMNILSPKTVFVELFVPSFVGHLRSNENVIKKQIISFSHKEKCDSN